jgi:hypothetical protein
MDPADEQAIGGLVAAFYAAFDNRAGRRPDVLGLRGLFAPFALIVRVSAAGTDNWTVHNFLEPRAALLTDGTLTEFHEWEVRSRNVGGRRIASRWSEYEKAGVRDGTPFRGAGRKLIGLHRGGEGWLISSVLWEDHE